MGKDGAGFGYFFLIALYFLLINSVIFYVGFVLVVLLITFEKQWVTLRLSNQLTANPQPLCTNYASIRKVKQQTNDC